ncbi:hypothetical protein PTTG_26460 [Puccinia triticina 1-1 BBBD Race 1]|uniref:CCHC-type domain-containing protein n=1 Tax=Puccinia triticina (isolate 1-1 / race 1 (BBBD)) TaxID=630390 RepID=A0A180GUN6_PUCT1|nr:hypothetical protein PTTG_26460 [Puccinia triticina 1-1 BBBD Race 1]
MAEYMNNLRQRVEELSALIHEERTHRQRAKADLESIRAQMVAPAVVPIIPPQQPGQHQPPGDVVAKGPKIGLPDKYNGTKGAKAEVYVTQIGLYNISNPQMFPDDQSKVIFSISYLTGQASAWAQPFKTRLFLGQVVTYESFFTAFQMMYYDTKKRSPEANKVGCPLYVSVQSTRGRRGLGDADELTDLSNLALKIDNKINGADLTPIDVAQPDPNAMDLSAVRGQLSGKEKAEMMWAGLFFYCGGKGHVVRDCPEKKPKGKGKALGAAVRISELEEEVRRLTVGPKPSGEGGRADQSKNGDARE